MEVIEKIVNRRSSLFALYSVSAIALFVLFLIANAMMYYNAYQFAQKHGADEIVIDYDDDPDYQGYFFTGEFSAPITVDYKPSHFKFYADGEDIVIEKELYFEYQDLNIVNNGYMSSIDLLISISATIAAIGLFSAMFSRHFYHSYFTGFALFFLVIFTTIDFYLNFWGILGLLVMFSVNVYFAKKNRFCDYNENRLTAIFK